MKTVLAKTHLWLWTLWNHRRIIKNLETELMKPFDLRFREMKARHDEIEIKVDSEQFSLVTGIFIKALKSTGAKNYVVVTMMDGFDPYEVTIQRKLGETPMDHLKVAEKRIAELEKQLTEP